MQALRIASCSTRNLCRIPVSFNKFAGIRLLANAPAATKQENTETSNWQPIYKFSFIKHVATMNKLKIYQFMGTAIAIPAAYGIDQAVVEGLENLSMIASIIGVTGLLTISLASYAFKGTVGFVYTHKTDPELVKFAYLDFWGIRRDVEMKIEDVVPFSEIPQSVFDRLYTTLRFNNSLKLKLCHKFGGILEHTEFVRVFGSL